MAIKSFLFFSFVIGILLSIYLLVSNAPVNSSSAHSPLPPSGISWAFAHILTLGHYWHCHGFCFACGRKRKHGGIEEHEKNTMAAQNNDDLSHFYQCYFLHWSGVGHLPPFFAFRPVHLTSFFVPTPRNLALLFWKMVMPGGRPGEGGRLGEGHRWNWHVPGIVVVVKRWKRVSENLKIYLENTNNHTYRF